VASVLLRHLTRCGRLPQAEPDEEEVQPDEPLLAELYVASVQGRAVLGEGASSAVERLGRRRGARPLFLPGELCCDIDGFSLHAKVEIEAHDRDGLELLCRYLARPPLASERLSLAPDGRVIYGLRRHWKDGTRAVVFDPLDFIARLAASSLSSPTARSCARSSRTSALTPSHLGSPPPERRPSSTSPADNSALMACLLPLPTGCGTGQALPTSRETRRGTPRQGSQTPRDHSRGIDTDLPARQRPAKNDGQGCRAAGSCASLS